MGLVVEGFNSNFKNWTLKDSRGFQADSLELVMLYDKDLVLKKGTSHSVKLGKYNRGNYFLNSASIDSSGFVNVQLLAHNHSASFSKLRELSSKSWKNKTLGFVLLEVAQNNNFKLKINPEIGGVFCKNIDRVNETALGFIWRLASQHDAYVKLSDSLIIIEYRGSKVNKKPINLNTSVIKSIRMNLLGDAQYNGVKAKYYNNKTWKQEAVKDGNSPFFSINEYCSGKRDAELKVAAKMRELQRTQKQISVDCGACLDELCAEKLVNIHGCEIDILNGVFSIDSIVHRPNTTTFNATLARD